MLNDDFLIFLILSLQLPLDGNCKVERLIDVESLTE